MEEVLLNTEEKMEKTLANLEEEYQMIRAGRANPHLLDKLTVNYYGAPSPLQSVSNISVPEARMIVITPWDKSLIKDICKAIQASDIGINPSTDGQTVRLVFPELTGERRKELAKEIKKKAEDAKVAIRNIRRDANEQIKKLEKASEITEDERTEGEEESQKLTDKFIRKIDDAAAKKTDEVMTI